MWCNWAVPNGNVDPEALRPAPTYPPNQRRASGGQGREATDPRRGLRAAKPGASIERVGGLEPRSPDIQLDPWLPNLQPMLKLKPALMTGKPSLRVLSRQALSRLRRLGAEGASSVTYSMLQPEALDLADALIPDARLGRLCGPLPQLLDDVGGRLDPGGCERLSGALSK